MNESNLHEIGEIEELLQENGYDAYVTDAYADEVRHTAKGERSVRSYVVELEFHPNE